MDYIFISLAFAGGLVTGAFVALVAIIYILIDEDNGSAEAKEAVEADTMRQPGPITMFEPKLRVSWPWATVLLCAMLMASLGFYLIRSAS